MTAVTAIPDLVPELQAAYEALSQRDDGLARLVARDGTPDPFTWRVLENAAGGDAFAELALHIVSQQISTAAVLTISGRRSDRLSGEAGPAAIIATSDRGPASRGPLGRQGEVPARSRRARPRRPAELAVRAELWRPFRSYAAALLWAHGTEHSIPRERDMNPTIILTHGAYADSSSWNGVIAPLAADGHRVIAWANPLRSIATDAAALSDLIRSIEGPVLLAGHSYGGAVMTNVDPDAGDVIALVYVAGFALDHGESPADASSLAPGSTLAETLERMPLADGGADTYIAHDKFHRQFAADLPAQQSDLMAVTQRPVTEAALFEPSGDRPLWRSVPSWFIFGELDRNIPAGAHRLMSDRADARRTVEISGASHVVGVSHPNETAQLVLEASGAHAVAHI